MKKILLSLSCILMSVTIALCQSSEISSQSITFPKFTTPNRPPANSVGLGSILFNSTENLHQYSNGNVWLNLVGANSLPSGTINQTLRNNGTNWIVDDNLKNNGTNVWIGNIAPVASDFLTVTAPSGLNNTAIKGVAPDGYGVLGSSTSGFGMIGISNSFVGVKGRANAASGVGVFGESLEGKGVVGTSNNNYGIEGSSTTSIGIVGRSQTSIGVTGESSSNYGVTAISDSGIGFVALSSTNYSAMFIGRLQVLPNSANVAGIEFLGMNGFQNGYVGMNGDNEMGIFGYGLNDWIQRWNIYTGSICYATTPTICSDIRLKKDFRPIQNSFTRLSQLKGYTYLWKNEKMKDLQTGFIAQDIQKVFPELVTTDDKGFLSVNYVGLIPHLVEANKILQKQNEDLLSRVERLEKILLTKEISNELPKTKK